MKHTLRASCPNHSQHHRRTLSRVVRWLFSLGLMVSIASALLPGPVAAAPPNQPTASVQASGVAVSAGEVDLTWTATGLSASTDIGVTRDGQYLGSVKSSVNHFEDYSVQAATTYTYELDSQDKRGNVLVLLATVVVTTPAQPDTASAIPPSEPEGFSATPAADGGVYLDWWAASGDNDITAYRIFRDGSLVITLDAGYLSYIDEDVNPGKTYTYTIEAFDTAGNHSVDTSAQVTLPKNPPTGNKHQVVHGYGSALTTSSTSTTAPAVTTTPAISPAVAVASGYNSALRRYPYLTDAVGQYVTVNWATDHSGTAGTVTYGQVVNGSCTPTNIADAIRTGISVNGVGEFQWKADLSLTPDTEYCYRVYLDAIDLLGSNSTPQFKTQVAPGSNESYSFAVVGDWAQLDSSDTNPDMANLMQQIANSGARFAVTVGDNGYPSGTQTNYGDLQQTGVNTSAVFGPSYWAVPGSSIPIFAAIGNHGFGSSAAYHPQLLNFPQDQAVALSGGSYSVVNYCCINGITSSNYPNAWYAFDAGVARFYVLEAAWPDGNVGNVSMYQDDHDFHWIISSDEYAWLQQDLASHPRAVKFAFFHFPLYSDNATEPTDPLLQAPGSLQGLLDQYGVNVSFYGHTHTYQRNTPDSAGMASYLTGGGGAKLEPIGAGSATCSANDAYAVGWSYSANGGLGGGSSCGSAPTPTAPSQVFHFLLVTVADGTITVTPVDSTGQVFDQMMYSYSSSDTQAPTTPANLTATSSDPHRVDLNWDAASDNMGITGYTIYRDGSLLNTVDGSTTGYTDTTVSPGVTYTYTVDAFDAAGNHSQPSSAATVTPMADTQPPSVPANMSAQTATSLRVNVSWDASSDNIGVSDYDVYRDGVLVAENLNQTSFADVLVNSNTTYSYQVLARDTSGNVSNLSSPTTVTTPGAVFIEGFESGSLGAWTTTKGLTVEGSAVHTGSYAAEALSDASNTTGTYAKKTLPASYSDVYFRSYFDAISAGNQLNLMRVRTSSGSTLGYVYVTTSGALGLHNDTTRTNTLSGATVLPGTGWHSLTLHVAINGAASTAEVWLDGVPVPELSLTSDWGTAPIGQIQIGDTASGKIYDVIYDDVAFDPVTGDTQPPTVPTGVVGQSSQALGVDLSWTASSDNVGVTGYDVYRNGALLSRNVSQTSFTDVLVDPNISYSYQVLARDGSGNTSALSVAVNVTTPSAAFSDGFESGTLNAWTTTNGLIVESSTVHAGGFAVEGSVTSGNAYAKATLTGAYGDFYLRTFINLVSSSSQVNVLRWRDQSGASIGDIYVTAGGHLGLHSDVTSTNISSSASMAAGGGWHVIELHLVLNGATSQTQVWLDGILVPELTTTGDWGTAPIGQIQIGDTSSGTYDVVYDDVAFAGVTTDVSAPSTPTNLQATENGANEVDLTWTASTDDVGVTGYTIYRDGVLLNTVDGTTITYNDTTVQSNTSYTYTVDAVDAAGNHSPQSTPAYYSPADNTPPTVPAHLTTSASSLRVDLSWTASSDNVGVTGYDVYRDGTLLASVDGTTTSYTDVTVDPSGTYSYQVLAKDAAGNSSDLSAPTNVGTPAAVFSDGFESGDLSAWNSNKGMTVEGTSVHSGSYAVEALSDSSNTTGTYAKKNVPGTYSNVDARVYINIQSIGNNQINMLRLRTASGSSLGYLYVTSNGVLGLRNDTTGVNTLSSGVVLPGSSWHTLHLHLVVNGSISTIQVWLDGALVPELSLTASWGTTPVGQIQIGDTLSGRSYDIVYDDIAFAGS